MKRTFQETTELPKKRFHTIAQAATPTTPDMAPPCWAVRQSLAAGLGFTATAPLLMREAIGAEVGQPSAPANKNRITARAYGATGRPLGHVPVAHPAPAVSGTANVKKNSSEKKMKEDNEHVQRTIQEQNGQSRREFILTSALAVAGAGAAGILNPARAFGGESKYPSGQGNGPYPTEGMAAYSETGPLKLMQFQRRALGAKDVAIKIHYCGVCHSDIHTIHGDWGKIQYPQIVGHELGGEVVAVGSSVSKFNVGSRVGVGTMVDSCRHCPECLRGSENYCENGNTQTYASKDRDGTITQGGYSKFIVVDEDFVLKIPDSIDLAEVGPMLCAGITCYSPLRHWSVAPGKKVAVLGLGGLGHLAVQLATAMGAQVTVITTSPDKSKDAQRFGAKDVLINQSGVDFSKYKRAFDFILDTIPYQHDLDRFIPLLRRDATLCRVGVGKLTTPNEYGQMTTVLNRTALAGSNTGGIRETQDMLEFCALQKIKPQITKIPMDGINDAWSKVIAKQARYRFVMDMGMRG